jgi:hypothetical protein
MTKNNPFKDSSMLSPSNITVFKLTLKIAKAETCLMTA